SGVHWHQLVSQSYPQRHDIARRGLSAELGPIVHEPSPPVEQVASLVRAFDRAADIVRQRKLRNLARIRCLLRRPIAERGPEAVRGNMTVAEPLERYREAILVHPAAPAGEHKIAGPYL